MYDVLPVVTTVDFTALSLYRFSVSFSLSVCLSQYHNPCKIKFLSSSLSLSLCIFFQHIYWLTVMSSLQYFCREGLAFGTGLQLPSICFCKFCKRAMLPPFFFNCRCKVPFQLSSELLPGFRNIYIKSYSPLKFPQCCPWDSSMVGLIKFNLGCFVCAAERNNVISVSENTQQGCRKGGWGVLFVQFTETV